METSAELCVVAMETGDELLVLLLWKQVTRAMLVLLLWKQVTSSYGNKKLQVTTFYVISCSLRLTPRQSRAQILHAFFFRERMGLGTRLVSERIRDVTNYTWWV